MNKRVTCVFAFILITFTLCSCFNDDPQKSVCTLKDEKANIEVNANYNADEIVESIEVKFTQQFTEKAVANMSESEIEKTLALIFSESGNENVQVKVTYNKRKRIGEVYMNISMDQLSKQELAEFNLYKDIKVKDFIKAMKAKEFKCEVIE